MACTSISLDSDKTEEFVTAQWKCVPQFGYVVYRVLVALFFACWNVAAGAVRFNWAKDDSQRVKWFIYKTNWSFTLLTLSSILQAICCAHAFLQNRRQKSAHISSKAQEAGEKESRPLHWSLKLSWILYNVSSLTAIVVTVLFWVILYPDYKRNECPDGQVLTSCGSPCTPTCSDPHPVCVEMCEQRCQCPEDAPYWHEGVCLDRESCPQPPFNATMAYTKTELYEVHIISFMIHGGNAIYVLLNLCITAMPMRLLHYVHYLLYAMVYTGFTYLYYLCGGTNAMEDPYIYSVLDWRDVGLVMKSVAAILLLTIVLWVALVVLTVGRQKIAEKIHGSTPAGGTCDDVTTSDQELKLMTSVDHKV